jgi:hypothetical protein
MLSDFPLTESGGDYSCNFISGISKAYRNGQKSLNGGVYGMFAEDADGNGQVESLDKTGYWALQAGNKGYETADFNMNSRIDNIDKNDFWIENNNASSQIPD